MAVSIVLRARLGSRLVARLDGGQPSQARRDVSPGPPQKKQRGVPHLSAQKLVAFASLFAMAGLLDVFGTNVPTLDLPIVGFVLTFV
jgi:hypothetical protein